MWIPKEPPTVLAIVELQNRIIGSISNKKWCIGIFLDLSKAFDTLYHNILLHKLSHYSVRVVAFDWFRSYLTNRMQYTEFGSATSSKLPIECGVPQGSILLEVNVSHVSNITTQLLEISVSEM